jgi:hypothetical protein
MTSLYRALKFGGAIDQQMVEIWKSKVPKKIFEWLPTIDFSQHSNLRRSGKGKYCANCVARRNQQIISFFLGQ